MAQQLLDAEKAAIMNEDERRPLIANSYRAIQQYTCQDEYLPGIKKLLTCFVIAVVLLLGLRGIVNPTNIGCKFPGHIKSPSCDTVDHGYQCNPSQSHNWGQYAPYFSVPSEIPTELPPTCRITFGQMLARHGARYPGTSKSIFYSSLIDRIHDTATDYIGDFAFLKDFIYELGAEDLTHFGQDQLVNTGIQFYNRYQPLARTQAPFIRAAGSPRVIMSAQNFTQGFQTAKSADNHDDNHSPTTPTSPLPVLVISEDPDSNNTLNYGLCTNFAQSWVHSIAAYAKLLWRTTFLPPLYTRILAHLPNANLTLHDTIYLMDLCPFHSVSLPNGTPSPFCNLFTAQDFVNYNYYRSLEKYYGYGAGNPLGPTQGVGFANELLARMTGKPVRDHTSTNRTLDADNATFPVAGPAHALFADFSHDNDMVGIFAALRLHDGMVRLPNETMVLPSEKEAAGFAASWVVPFGARAYFEKMRCEDDDEGYDGEWVRVVLNGRVMPLEWCGGDEWGRCKLENWVEGLQFVREGGRWEECFDEFTGSMWD